ncbi:MAG: hypothetical protein LAN64_18000, partial [Acidobacteriia bacterium]|nr:hypothetical protein [Terriglobia bacterium]
EDGAALIHEPLCTLLAFESRQARNGFNLLRSYYLQPSPCNLTGQQCSKIRDTDQQKTKQNSFQQVQNLDGVFDIDRNRIQGSPVLLVDDMVDSRWTFTTLAAKLRQSGTGPVFPFALADASAGDGD